MLIPKNKNKNLNLNRIDLQKVANSKNRDDSCYTLLCRILNSNITKEDLVRWYKQLRILNFLVNKLQTNCVHT